MGNITVIIDDDVEKEFRKLVKRYEGSKKGDFDRAATEAIIKWIEEKKQNKIAERQMEMSRKGIYSLPKGWKFNRDKGKA